MSLLDMQVAGGMVLLVLTIWQLATGMRWVKLGRKTFKVHKWSGIALLVLGLPHMVIGLQLAGWIRF